MINLPFLRPGNSLTCNRREREKEIKGEEGRGGRRKEEEEGEEEEKEGRRGVAKVFFLQFTD